MTKVGKFLNENFFLVVGAFFIFFLICMLWAINKDNDNRDEWNEHLSSHNCVQINPNDSQLKGVELHLQSYQRVYTCESVIRLIVK